MVQFIKIQIISASDQTSHHADIGLVARTKHQRGFLMEKFGQTVLELLVEIKRPVQEATPGTPTAISLQGIGSGLKNLGVVGQAQVIIRPHHNLGIAINRHFCPIRSFDGYKKGIIPPACASRARVKRAHLSRSFIQPPPLDKHPQNFQPGVACDVHPFLHFHICSYSQPCSRYHAAVRVKPSGSGIRASKCKSCRQLRFHTTNQVQQLLDFIPIKK